MVTTVCSKVTRDFDTLGAHTLRWRYVRDSNGSGGDNAGWVDCVQWTPASSSSGDWQEIQYAYDASGRRVAKDVDGVLTKYLYDGSQCIAEYDANDTLLRKYIYGPGIDQPICMIDVEDANAAYYYHYDALGSVVAISDANGATAQIYDYDVYGQVATYPPDDTNPFLFTGRRYDTETGLYYYRARYYDPTIGRFLQTDPVGYEDGMNWYAYCENNPVNCIDPLGLAHYRAFYYPEQGAWWWLLGEWDHYGMVHAFRVNTYQAIISKEFTSGDDSYTIYTIVGGRTRQIIPSGVGSCKVQITGESAIQFLLGMIQADLDSTGFNFDDAIRELADPQPLVVPPVNGFTQWVSETLSDYGMGIEAAEDCIIGYFCPCIKLPLVDATDMANSDSETVIEQQESEAQAAILACPHSMYQLL